MSAINLETDSLIIRKSEKQITRERNEIGILVMVVKIHTLMCDKLNEKLVLIGITVPHFASSHISFILAFTKHCMEWTLWIVLDFVNGLNITYLK